MCAFFYEDQIQAGFPSPAEGNLEKKLDLNRYLIKHPAATFFVRVTGDSMKDAGIFPDDILIVDRALDPKSGKIVVAMVNGAFTVKRLIQEKNSIFLEAANPLYPTLHIKKSDEFQVWGVVTYVIHKAV